MRPAPLALLVALAAPAAPAAPPGLADLGPLERQTADFYGALAGGRSVTVAWSVSPPSAPLSADLTLTLTVSHALNPHELAPPPLADRPEFQRLFSVVELIPQPTPDPAAARVEFRYRVRPRAAGAFRTPQLRYVFARRGGGRTTFQTAYAEPAPYTVTRPADPPVPPRPLDGPPAFFELREGRFARSGGPGPGGWAGLVVAAVLAGAGWVFGWRRLYPDGPRLARLRRNRAVRTALDRLRAAARSPDPAAATGGAFRGYLVARHGIPPAAQTPADVATALHAAGLPPERVAEAEGVLRRLDAVRFGPADAAAPDPAAVAGLIERWEGVRG